MKPDAMMAAMTPPRRFVATVLPGSFFLALAAFIYAHLQSTPAWAAIPIAAAFIVEFPFYLLPGFLPQASSLPLALAATCVLPYLV